MTLKQASIFVFGAEQICSSCLHSPSSKDTFEWLEAALMRKFPASSFQIEYIDIFHPPIDKDKQQLAKRIIDEEMIYPVVVMEGKVIAEGNPHLPSIYRKMEAVGIKPNS